MTPRIHTFTATDPDTPAHMRAAAAMDQTAPGLHWMVTGPTPEAAAAKLKAFWDDTEARKPKDGPKKAKAPPGPAHPQPGDDEDVL